LDFDNIFGGLLTLDREAASSLAREPGALLARLRTYGLGEGSYRDVLVRRAYLNPNGFVLDKELGNERGRLYLTKYRPFLTRAGFEVIDCPALTSAQKNAADIKMVIDVLSAIDQPARYDEVIVASSDADFTPLLQHLRAQDRRTMIITAGATAPPYQSIADVYLDDQSFIGLLKSSEGWDESSTDAASPDRVPVPTSSVIEDREATSSPTEGARDPATVAEAKAKALDQFGELIRAAAEPLTLSAVGNLLHERVGTEVIKASRWFGLGSLPALVREYDERLEVRGYYVWDPQRHHEPSSPSHSIELPAIVEEACSLLDVPRLSSISWTSAFETLSEYARTHSFNLTEATSWSRDRLAEAGLPVGRQSLGFIIRGCLHHGVRLDREPPPSAEELGDAFLGTVTERARSAGLDLSEADLDVVRSWITGRSSSDGS
jgi:hypothetical protein